MSYPSQPGNQPNPYWNQNQPNPYGQAQPNPYGQAQPGGYGYGPGPSSTPHQPWSQQQPGQPGYPTGAPYGQPHAGYGPYGGMHAAQGGYPNHRPPSRRTGLIIGAVAVAAVLIGGVVTLVLVLTTGGGPQDVAEDAVEAINTRDVELARSISCDKSETIDFGDMPPGLRIEIAGDATVNGNDATVPVRVTVGGKTERDEFDLDKDDGEWCMDDIG